MARSPPGSPPSEAGEGDGAGSAQRVRPSERGGGVRRSASRSPPHSRTRTAGAKCALLASEGAEEAGALAAAAAEKQPPRGSVAGGRGSPAPAPRSPAQRRSLPCRSRALPGGREARGGAAPSARAFLSSLVGALSRRSGLCVWLSRTSTQPRTPPPPFKVMLRLLSPSPLGMCGVLCFGADWDQTARGGVRALQRALKVATFVRRLNKNVLPVS